jgi:hypothetical protein
VVVAVQPPEGLADTVLAVFAPEPVAGQAAAPAAHMPPARLDLGESGAVAHGIGDLCGPCAVGASALVGAAVGIPGTVGGLCSGKEAVLPGIALTADSEHILQAAPVARRRGESVSYHHDESFS